LLFGEVVISIQPSLGFYLFTHLVVEIIINIDRIKAYGFIEYRK